MNARMRGHGNPKGRAPLAFTEELRRPLLEPFPNGTIPQPDRHFRNPNAATHGITAHTLPRT